MENEIIKYLKGNNYRPNYVWVPTNYLNGFLVKIENYRSEYLDEFIKVMDTFCDNRYSIPEKNYAKLKNYRLTQFGYEELILK